MTVTTLMEESCMTAAETLSVAHPPPPKAALSPPGLRPHARQPERARVRNPDWDVTLRDARHPACSNEILVGLFRRKRLCESFRH